MHRPYGGCTFEGEIPSSPNRHPALPRFFLTHDHPKNLGRPSWIGSADPVELARLSKSFFRDVGYPTIVDEAKLHDLGLLEIPDGVTVFLENIRGSRLREDDVVKIISVGADENRRKFPDDVANLELIRNRILGPREARDASNPKGTAFERMERSKTNGQGGRSYSTALTTEVQRGLLTHPAANIRSMVGEEGALNAEQQLYKDFNEVNICLSSLYALLFTRL